jgi:hypothetical protein
MPGSAADEAVGDDRPVQRFDGAGCDLVVATAVQATILSHERWGVMAEVLGHETAGASVDAGVIDSPSGSPRALPEEYPPVGERIDAVVQQADQPVPPARLDTPDDACRRPASVQLAVRMLRPAHDPQPWRRRRHRRRAQQRGTGMRVVRRASVMPGRPPQPGFRRATAHGSNAVGRDEPSSPAIGNRSP